jgi:hypothetical protein
MSSAKPAFVLASLAGEAGAKTAKRAPWPSTFGFLADMAERKRP